MADHLLLLPSPAQQEISPETILAQIKSWLENIYETASITAKGTQEAFDDLMDKLLDYEAARIEQGLWPSRGGQLQAMAVDLWYQAERQFLHNKNLERKSVQWQYTEDDSDTSDVDSDEDEDDVRTTA